jgi:hypothetical protein
MSGFLGCGKLYGNRTVGGVSQGWSHLGNATKLGLKSNSELKEQISKSCATYGQALNAVVLKKPDDLTISLDDLNKDNLAIVFLGDSSQKVVVAGTVTSEPQTAVFGKLIELANGNVSAVVVTNVGAVVTYTEGVDYKIDNASVGFIEIIESGSITDGLDLEITYVNGGITSSLVKGGTNSSVKMALKLVGKNLVDDSNVTVNIWEAVLSPQSEIDFLADDYSVIELNGRVNLYEPKGNGFEVEIDKVLA